ncbi:MAG TPA: hypothetical protein V6C90_08300 [Coleofasciculaceae cyanobacterium]|jgi:acyl carrier protein
MSSTAKNSALTREEIQSRVIAVLEDMTADWELDSSESIGSETGLMEHLAFESIDVVQLVVALEKEFDCKGLPFEKLFMNDGDYVDEILVKEVVDFLSEDLKK